MIPFSKYQGLGNDFVIVDGRDNEIDNQINSLRSNRIRSICNRHFGIGADGLIFILKSSNDINYRMRIFNADGSEAEMCGNGIRCLTKYLYDHNQFAIKDKLTINTLAGPIKVQMVNDNFISVDMGRPSLAGNTIPTTMPISDRGLPETVINIGKDSYQAFAVGMGNPHLVIIVNRLEDISISEWGPILEINKMFPLKTNVHFIQIIDRKTIKAKVWERGSGITLACGTGACSIHVVSHILGLCESESEIQLPGGSLYINWTDRSQSVYMKGPANFVFNGFIKQF